MTSNVGHPERFVAALSRSGLTIYDPLRIGDPDLWIPSPELEMLLDAGMQGFSLAGLPLRTRSKALKQEICRILGYPVPLSFKKTKPRFPGQQFDVYGQKSNNFQPWNEELEPTRRYVIVRVAPDDVITRVKVATGEDLALLDTTGTLTQKYQARLNHKEVAKKLIVAEDTERLKPLAREGIDLKAASVSPIDHPSAGMLLSISAIYEKLNVLVGSNFPDRGRDQERNRGADLHRLVCQQLGYKNYADNGRFPDVRHQLLELKLQTSPTIDLGLVLPNSEEALDVSNIEGRQIRHCDVRYALFRAHTDGKQVILTGFYLTTGAAFFSYFPQFQGKVLNKKLQIRLPFDFFDR
jgi:hypothetical protein